MPTNSSTAAERPSVARLLRERLRSLIPVEQIAVESLQEALGRVRQEVLPLAGVPVGELLLDPRVAFRKLKSQTWIAWELAKVFGKTAAT